MQLTGERSFTYNILMQNIESAKEKLKTFWDIHKRMPSFSEVAKLMGYKSKNAASKLIDKLEIDGFVMQDSKGKIIPGNSFAGLRMLGLVEAGFPSPAEEDNSDVISLDDFMIENRNSSFMLRVKGDSMIDVGIHSGDLVIADRGKEPRIGDIVVAELDGEWTMKYLRQNKGRKYLEAANSDYPDMCPEGELKIGAVVVGVMRKY